MSAILMVIRMAGYHASVLAKRSQNGPCAAERFTVNLRYLGRVTFLP
jgi:hypothetical protein